MEFPLRTQKEAYYPSATKWMDKSAMAISHTWNNRYLTPMLNPNQHLVISSVKDYKELHPTFEIDGKLLEILFF